MKCDAVQNIQIKPDRGTSSESSDCIATLSGFFIGDNMKRIPLTQGKFAIVNDEDFDRLNSFKWYAHEDRNTYYAVRTIRQNGKRKTILMHREIMELKAGDGRQTDHINHDGLDNRRDKLRICTNAENHYNQKPGKGTSKYKGCSWYKRDKKWQARIRLNSKLIHLGLFDSEIEAAKAYDAKAKELFGEFACVNITTGDYLVAEGTQEK